MVMEDGSGIPEDLRCKRSDGKQWRCNALSMPDKTVCEKHYIQAKKRAANSAMRANLKKARRKSIADPEPPEIPRSVSPLGDSQLLASVSLKTMMAGRRFQDEENPALKYGVTPNRSPLSKEVKGLLASARGEYSGKSSDSSGQAEGLACHQCHRSDRTNIVWCSGCSRRGYCENCISKWYADIPREEFRSNCPVCRNACSCRMCSCGDNLIKNKIQEMASLDKLRYLHRLLSFLLPVLKQIHSEQCFELELEARVNGVKADIPRAKISADEQMCCDVCRIPIFDYHRHCTTCYYDLCLACCRDLRESSAMNSKNKSTERHVADGSNDVASIAVDPGSPERTINHKRVLPTSDGKTIEFSELFPKWKADADGSIPCGPVDAGGCGSSKLVLRRILKINWLAKLLKNTEEMVCGCKVSDQEGCGVCPCTRSATSQTSETREWKLSVCSQVNGTSKKLLYSPSADDLKHDGIDHFQKHWVKGEPVIIKHAFDPSFASKWDPVSVWKGIQEMEDGRMKEEDILVKAVDFLKQSEVDVELSQFVKGYREGCKREDGSLVMLKLKDWPSPGVLEDFILCQRPEFFTSLPLLEFIHFKWGLLNLAAKLPPCSVQTEHGPKMFIGYGMHEELGRGDVVTNLQVNMSDLVYLLMHSSEMDIQGWGRSDNDMNGKDLKESEMLSSVHLVDSSMRSSEEMPSPDVAGVIWDVFSRKDVPKLNEYLRVHRKELTGFATQPVVSVLRPVYDQTFFLNKDHKRKLKEEFGIEPWTFEQHVGEAICIPAGCSFQVRNLQSSVMLALGFLSPESLEESIGLAQEIRCLPNHHDAKLKMLEVGKISLYAASSVITDIQKMTLDPEFGRDIKFEDQNLTSMISENLERMTKHRQIVCS